jgi:tetratricopeptide (TPR) repeat protein
VKRYYFILFVSFSLGSFSAFSQNAKQHFKAGEQFFENGMMEAALESFEESIKLDPIDGRTYESVAIVYLQKGDTLQALENFRKAAALNYNPSKNYYQAAQLSYQINNIEISNECIALGLTIKPKDIDLLLLKTQLLFEAENYTKAYEVSNEAISAKDLALAYYYNGASAYKIGLIDEAEKKLEKAIIRDKNLSEAYLAIAEIQLEQKRYDYAVDNCSMVLLLIDPESVEALVLRSRGFSGLVEPDDALADITKAIGLSKNDYNLILERAKINMEYALYADAIQDYSVVLGVNDSVVSTYKERAYAYEQLGQKTEALFDYISMMVLLEKEKGADELKNFTQSRIYELGKESNKPEIVVEHPVINDNLELKVEQGVSELQISGKIFESSDLKEIKINSVSVDFVPVTTGEYLFNYSISTNSLDFISITAVDIYENVNTESYPIFYIETDAPVIELISPIAGSANVIQLETNDNTLYIEGRVIDKSNIASIRIDEVNASFIPGDYNPKFTATIDVQNRKNISVIATDAFGNETKQTFEFSKDGYLLSDNNAMGKTWVVIVENSTYNDYTSLSGPSEDVVELSNALNRYQISKVLHKQNMSKRELERFFAIDLRDLIISNKVNSLLIWYAGHGQNVNGTGYWIPVDGRQNDEYSFYNINALKASLYSYQSLTHILVVSDACYAGESFSLAMRGENSSASCDDLNAITNKSALVLTSTNNEQAMDNSLFTKTFANALANNPTDCIPIDAIANRISIVLNKNSTQKPVFGKIAGLEDKNGTFFFISK